MSLSLYGLRLFLFPAAKYTRKSKRFSWKEEETSYYNIVSCYAIVFGILASVYMADEEKEIKR